MFIHIKFNLLNTPSLCLPDSAYVINDLFLEWKLSTTAVSVIVINIKDACYN